MSKKILIAVLVGVLLVLGALGYFIYRTVALTGELRAAETEATEEVVEAPAEVEAPVVETEGESPAEVDFTDGTTVINITASPLVNADLADLFAGTTPVNTSVPWDDQKWNWQAIGLSSTPLEIPVGWAATVTIVTPQGGFNEGDVVLFYGPISLDGIGGYTARYIYGTPVDATVRTPCAMLEAENAYSLSQVPAYPTLAGNFSCPVVETP